MKNQIRFLAAMLCAFPLLGFAADHATRDEAVAMVKKGVAFWKTNGDDKTFAAAPFSIALCESTSHGPLNLCK